MKSITEYMTKTESAVRLLFEGIASYSQLLPNFNNLIFVSSEETDINFDVEFSKWQSTNANVIATEMAAERKYLAESFALDTLCGAVFHIAEKAIEVYSKNALIPPEWTNLVRAKTEKYCCGRLVRTVPLGLVIYAARNKHAHYNENLLHPLSAAVFERLATEHEYKKSEVTHDPAYDLRNPKIGSCAHNVMTLIDWTTYEKYAHDIATLIQK
jgi:hypothetical protein